jgi:hypothetical protein
MWRWRHRNTIYPFISGAGTTALLVFLLASALLQVAAIRDRTEADRATSSQWQTLLTPHAARDVTPEFSIAFSDREGDGDRRQN